MEDTKPATNTTEVKSLYARKVVASPGAKQKARQETYKQKNFTSAAEHAESAAQQARESKRDANRMGALSPGSRQKVEEAAATAQPSLSLPPFPAAGQAL